VLDDDAVDDDDKGGEGCGCGCGCGDGDRLRSRCDREGRSREGVRLGEEVAATAGTVDEEEDDEGVGMEERELRAAVYWMGRALPRRTGICSARSQTKKPTRK
jgi:hypothetical protein